MTDFLSDSWIEALDERLRDQATGSSSTPLVIQYHVARDDGTEVHYHLRIGPDGDRAQPGVAPDPHVTFRMGLDTAQRISAGEMSSEEAFLAGLLDLEGDAEALIEAHRGATGE